MMKKNSLLKLAIILSSLNYSVSATPSVDFDGDGYSDPVLISVARDGGLSWRTQLSTTGTGLSLGAIGRIGVNAIYGSWTAPGSGDIGVVAPTLDEHVEWKILDVPDRSVVLGDVQGYALSGGDLNGNGILDAVVVNKLRRRSIWNVHLDPFAKEPLLGEPNVRKISFGKWSDTHFLAPLADGGYALGIITRDERRRTIIQKYDLATNTISTQRRISRFFATKGLSRPEAIRGADGEIRLLITQKQNSSVRLYVYSLKGRLYTKTTIVKDGDTIIGDFGPDAGEEVAVQQGRNIAIYNPSSGSVITRPIGEGILVDKNNDNLVEQNLIPPQSGGESEGGGSPTVNAPPVGAVANCASITPFPSSHIYKMIGSTHFSPTDVRRNTIGLVIKPGGQGPFPSCITVVNTNGNVLANMGLYQRGNGWEARYYAGIGCGSETPYNGQTIASMARQSGNGPFILFNLGSLCYGPIDASQCVGSSQC
jgi:hypothetical protein